MSLCAEAFGQHAHVRATTLVWMPSQVDSNSPAYWRDGSLNLLNSTGNGPVRSSGSNQFQLGPAQGVRLNRINPWPTWMEAVWVDPDGIIFGWYHQERFGLCGAKNLSAPQIGAAISFDGGSSFQDLGPVITSGDGIDCNSQNGYFAGGQGDLSVVLDRTRTYFYFLFSNYGGPVESQGVAIARMPYESRYAQAGNIRKYFDGDWTEPGLGGRVTPVFRARVSWQEPNTNAFWGPSLHWNTYLSSYVMLLNHSCCSPGFPQDGIFVSFTSDLSNPKSWTPPHKILADTGWYPQVLGVGPHGTDSEAGRVARLYVYGHSWWEIVFDKPDPTDPATPPQ